MPWRTCTRTSCTATSSPKTVCSKTSLCMFVLFTGHLDTHRLWTAKTSALIRLCSMISWLCSAAGCRGSCQGMRLWHRPLQGPVRFVCNNACRPACCLRSLHATETTDMLYTPQEQVTVGLLKETLQPFDPAGGAGRSSAPRMALRARRRTWRRRCLRAAP
jgi:hypothetical protein